VSGSWSLDSNNGLAAKGHYFGPQYGPIGLNVGINPTGNVTDDTSALRAMDAMSAGGTPEKGATMFEPGPSIGYTYFRLGSKGTTLFNVGVSATSNAVPYYPGGVYQPLSGPSLGPYAGARLRATF
jgi:hypothetical protein